MKLLEFKRRTVVSCERCGQELTDPESMTERNPRQIIKFTQVLKKLTGQLVRREMQRQERLVERKAVA